MEEQPEGVIGVILNILDALLLTLGGAMFLLLAIPVAIVALIIIVAVILTDIMDDATHRW